MLGDPDSCGVWAPCLTLRRRPVLADLHRREALRPHHGRRRVGRVAARLPQLPRHQPAHRRRVVRSGVPEQQRLRSVAVPRRRRPQVSASTCCGTTGPGRNRFAGIVLQEYSPAERRLIGERRLIFEGTALGFTEAPHLYKRDGYYYLLTAEGGTGWGHAVTMARSRSLTGPYELHPDTYILTARASARRRAAARRPRRPRRDARRRDLHGLSVRPAASRIAAAARSAARPRSSRWRGAPTAGCGPRTAQGVPTLEVAGAGAARRTRSRPRRCARTSTARRCRSTSSGCARRGPTSCSA